MEKHHISAKSLLEFEMKHSLSFFLLPVAFVFFLLLAGPGNAETRISVPHLLGISEAVQIAITHNPAVTDASAFVSVSKERLTQAKSGFFPRVSASAAYTRTTSPLWAFGTKLNQGKIGIEDFIPDRLNDPSAVDNYGLALSAVWPLYDSGQTWYGVRQAELGHNAAGLIQNRTIQEIISATVSAYHGVLLSGQHLETIRQALKTAEANEKIVRSRFESGFSVKSDLLQTQVHIGTLNQQRLQAESRLAIARAGLCVAMGVDADTSFVLSDKLNSALETIGGLDEWIDTAISTRPDLKAVLQQEAIAEAEIRKVRSSRLPSVALSAEYGANADYFNDGEDSYTVGAVVSVNLFSGFRVSSKIAEASAALKQIQSKRTGLEQKISMDTRSAYYQAKSTWQQIRVAETSVAQAEEALRIVQNRYENDLLTIVELLGAELALQQAKVNRLQAVHDYNIAKTNLALAAGTLNADFQ